MAQQAHAQTRMALVIGNGAYENLDKLRTPENDATTIGETLSSLGFQVFLATNLNNDRMRNAISLFQKKVEFADTVLVYFAGHGMQRDDENFLIPTDYNPHLQSTNASAINIETIVHELSNRLRTNLFIFDACFDDSNSNLIGNKTIAPPVNAPPMGSLITFSTTIGKKAYDGIANHSIFTGALLDNMKIPDIDIEELFRNTRRDVLVNSNNHQMPTTVSSLITRFQLNASQALENSAVDQSFMNLSEHGFSHKSVLRDMENGLEISAHDKAKQKLRKLLCAKLTSPLPPQCQ
ncbi:caspase family protein [Paramylibacter kogurei]|nr:caspase family protein [Amylibacter kogurei]